MGIKKHIHKYMRQTLKFATVWRCALPDCNHFMPPHQEGMITGRYSICWGCGNKFILDEFTMQNDMPECHNCKTDNEISLIRQIQ